jgi:prophage regulatory protein
MDSQQSETLLAINHVVGRTTLSRAFIYDAVRLGTFPAPIKISANRVAWRSSQIDSWIAAKIAEAA